MILRQLTVTFVLAFDQSIKNLQKVFCTNSSGSEWSWWRISL